MPIVLRSAAILSAALFGMAFANSRAADFEEPLSLFSQASSLLHNAAKPVGVEFFVNYFGVLEIAWMPHSEKSTAAHEDRNFTRGRRELNGNGVGLPGIYKLGAYVSNEPEASYPGGWGGSPFGFYAIAQQMLWEQSPCGKLPSQFSIFGGVVWSPPRRIGGQSKTHDPCG